MRDCEFTHLIIKQCPINFKIVNTFTTLVLITSYLTSFHSLKEHHHCSATTQADLREFVYIHCNNNKIDT